MNKRKVALFVFNSEPVVFAHCLLNGLDMQTKGWEVKVIIEGDATKQVSLLRNETKPFANIWLKAKRARLIDCVCRACAQKNTVVPAVIEQALSLCDEMEGHPSVARYIEEGYEILIF
ncbi:MAG: cytoplasmic protein [candidate division WOR-3 bacterium]